FRWATAAASYSFPAPDGSRPGTFQIPLRPSQLTRYGLRSLVYHETVPGHHFQIALEQENPALPRFRQLRAFGFISAYGEGRALGSRDSPKDFHRAVLGTGTVPLELLEQEVDAYIARLK